MYLSTVLTYPVPALIFSAVKCDHWKMDYFEEYQVSLRPLQQASSESATASLAALERF